MKRILDINKILKDREKEKQRQTKKSKGITQWERMKKDPVKFGHYKKWRKQRLRHYHRHSWDLHPEFFLDSMRAFLGVENQMSNGKS